MATKTPEQIKIPEHWTGISWEEKARENPLLAVMTTPAMADAPPSDFSEETLAVFFQKGKLVFDRHIQPLIARLEVSSQVARIVEYGCGPGRILRAIVDAGYRCTGIDISPTMLKHCRQYVPEAEVYGLDERNRCGVPDEYASLVFSYAVVQHISSLQSYITAFDEMCRILKPRGILAVQVNCDDFEGASFSNPSRTENYEDHSLHFTGGEPPRRHLQDQWSGVYIGHDRLVEILAERGVYLERWVFHNPKKTRAVWAICRKLK